jgi:mono/diheme cytochrome c family protein
MLIGTQWGAGLDGTNIGPKDAAPNYLSNSVLETYLQTFNQPNGAGVGSCVSCHAGATLTANVNVSADLSFLPSLVNPLLSRRKPTTPIPH